MYSYLHTVDEPDNRIEDLDISIKVGLETIISF